MGCGVCAGGDDDKVDGWGDNRLTATELKAKAHIKPWRQSCQPEPRAALLFGAATKKVTMNVCHSI